MTSGKSHKFTKVYTVWPDVIHCMILVIKRPYIDHNGLCVEPGVGNWLSCVFGSTLLKVFIMLRHELLL